MKILALDTSSDACSVALFDAGIGTMLAEERTLLQRGHAEILFSQIGRVTTAAGIALKFVDRFAVTIGPGTFTGVRIGLATARGLALAAGRPLIGMSSLEVVASGAKFPASRIIVAAFDARRGELYVQGFRGGEAITAPIAASAEDAAAALLGVAAPSDTFAAIGTGSDALANALIKVGARCDLSPGDPLPHASTLARIAAMREASSEPLAPLYLRAPDAKLPRGQSFAAQS